MQARPTLVKLDMGKGQDFQAGTLGNRFGDMRLLPFFALLLLATPQAQANLCFDLTMGGTFDPVTGNQIFTGTFSGNAYQLVISSAQGSITQQLFGLGVTGSGGNNGFVDNGETIEFSLSAITGGAPPLVITSFNANIVLGDYQTGGDTFGPGIGTNSLTAPSSSFTLTPTNTTALAAFSKIQAANLSAVPEPSALGLCGLMAFACFRRKKRRGVVVT